MNIALCIFFTVCALGYSFEAIVARRRHTLMMLDLTRVSGMYIDTLHRLSKSGEKVDDSLARFLDALPRPELIAVASAEGVRASISGICALLSSWAAVLCYYLIP